MYPKEGIFTCSMSVHVHLDPSETATFHLLNNNAVKEGDTVTMKCETDGNPQPTFDFTKDVRVNYVCMFVKERILVFFLQLLCAPLLKNTLLSLNLDHVSLIMCLFFYLQDKVIIGQGGLLTLKSVKRTDSGVYKCKAIDYDNIDADLSGEIVLTVNCE